MSKNKNAEVKENTIKDENGNAVSLGSTQTSYNIGKSVSNSVTNAATSAVANAEENKSQAPKGINQTTWDKANSEFTGSKDLGKANSDQDLAKQGVQNLVSPNGIVSGSVWDAISTEYEVPAAVTQADAWISSQLQTIQSGKTSYSDQVSGAMNKILNRESFSYDVDKDPLFQQALASAMGNGQQAMQNTIGQASALTGGYGSTYATTAGNQAYNSFIQDAYDNLPQYYNMALDAYNAEGEELYRQFDALNSLDDKEYNRNLTAYDATYQYRNQIYNESYTQHRDSVSDAFATGNLQLNEHGQLMSDATNYYNVTSDYSDSIYQREFNEWESSVNQAMQMANMQNSNYWQQTEFDEGVRQFDESMAEDKRQFDTTFNEDVRQFDTTFNEDVRQFNTTFAEDQRQFNETLAQNEKHHSEDLAFNYASLNARGSSGGGGGYGGSGGGGSVYTSDEMNAASKSPAVSSFQASIMTPEEFKFRGATHTVDGKTVRYDNWGQYVEGVLHKWNKNGQLSEHETAYLAQYYFGQ